MTYTPNLWVKGDTVSSEKLNHMELGIAQNDTGLQSKVNQEDFESEITNINNRIGSPLTANAANQMTDTNKVYVYTGSETGYTNGHWYYYDGSAWQDGGVYNAVAFETDDTLTHEGEAADAKETGTRFANFANSLNETDMEFSNFKTQTNGKFSNVEQSLIDIRANASEMDDDISDVKRDLILLMDEIPDTIQSYTFADGSVSQITHSRSDETIRTDSFTYGTDTITEVRTSSTGTLTIVTNLTTLETTVTYAAA